jgi:hypothetical protein
VALRPIGRRNEFAHGGDIEGDVLQDTHVNTSPCPVFGVPSELPGIVVQRGESPVNTMLIFSPKSVTSWRDCGELAVFPCPSPAFVPLWFLDHMGFVCVSPRAAARICRSGSGRVGAAGIGPPREGRFIGFLFAYTRRDSQAFMEPEAFFPVAEAIPPVKPARKENLSWRRVRPGKAISSSRW